MNLNIFKGWRVALTMTFGVSGIIFHCAAVHAYPTKPIRFVVTFAPGGGTDIIARAIGQKFFEKWGQPVIVDNRAGANGNIGTDMVAKSLADGYTILLTTNATIVINPHLYKKLAFNPATDFAPISMIATVPFVLGVNPSTPVRTVGELIDLAKTRPGKLTYAHTGAGGAGHMSGEMLKSMAKIDIVHIPYKGGSPATLALVGGEVNFMFVSILTTTPLIESNRIRAIAVTGRERSPSLPNVPTVAETPGLTNFETDLWYGMLAPAKTDIKIVKQLHEEVKRMLSLPEFKERFESTGTRLIGNSPEEFSKTIKNDLVRWGAVVRASGTMLD